MRINIKPDDYGEMKKVAVHSCCFSFLNVGLMLCSDSKSNLDKFKLIYQNFIVQELAGDYITCYILVRSSFCDDPCVIIDNVPYQLSAEDEVAGAVEMIILKKIIDRVDKYFLLHAGVVSKNGKGYIICAPSGFGKTTLVMELVSRGYKFLSDEYCPVNMDNYRITPFPRRVGLKNNSPLLNAANVNKCLFMEHETKQFADCNEIFPGCSGIECSANYMIMLAGSSDPDISKDTNITVLGLFNENESLLAEIEDCGVVVGKKYSKGFYIAYRFEIPKRDSLTGKFQNLWKKYRNDIFYVAIEQNEKPEFASSPSIELLSKSKAVIEILTLLINRSPAGKLMDKFGGKSSNIFLQAGEFTKNLKSYKLTTGKLNEVADMIDSLE